MVKESSAWGIILTGSVEDGDGKRNYSESHKAHRKQDFDGQIVQVACGQDHSLFLMDKGEVYSCGLVTGVQTGLGHYDITSMPTKLGGDLAGVNVVQVDTYGDCCLVMLASAGFFRRGTLSTCSLPPSPTPDR